MLNKNSAKLLHDVFAKRLQILWLMISFYQFADFCCQRNIEEIFVSSKSNMASMVMLHNHSYMIEAKESTEKDPLLPFFTLFSSSSLDFAVNNHGKYLLQNQNHHLTTMKKPGMISKAISVDLDNLNAMNSTMKKIINLTY